MISEFPLGGLGDGAYGGASEYGSLLGAVEHAEKSGRKALNVVELGAGWGPWISAAGIVGRNLDFPEINLVGVEADSDRFDLMGQHMMRNGLVGGQGINTRLIRGAAWKENTTLRFGALSANDHGGAATTSTDVDGDYRGFQVTYTDVAAFDLETICDGLDHVDYMHWDVQGAELEIADSGIELLNARVSHVFIGTHSPLIDGRLLDLFYRNGWDVVDFDPCPIKYDRSKPSLEAMSLRDGEIFAVNPRLF